MTALVLATATKDITVGDATSEAALETWIDSLSVTSVQGFNAVALSNTRIRYTILYVVEPA
jgi:hypothetical protein